MADVTLLPTVVNVTGKAGDRVRWTITVTDSNGDALNWSGYSFDAQIRVNPWDTATVATIAVDDSSSNIGVLVLTVLKANTTAMLPAAAAKSQSQWVWDMQRTNDLDTEDVRTTHAGTFALIMDVTRP